MSASLTCLCSICSRSLVRVVRRVVSRLPPYVLVHVLRAGSGDDSTLQPFTHSIFRSRTHTGCCGHVLLAASRRPCALWSKHCLIHRWHALSPCGMAIFHLRFVHGLAVQISSRRSAGHVQQDAQSLDAFIVRQHPALGQPYGGCCRRCQSQGNNLLRDLRSTRAVCRPYLHTISIPSFCSGSGMVTPGSPRG